MLFWLITIIINVVCDIVRGFFDVWYCEKEVFVGAEIPKVSQCIVGIDISEYHWTVHVHVEEQHILVIIIFAHNARCGNPYNGC